MDTWPPARFGAWGTRTPEGDPIARCMLLQMPNSEGITIQ